MFSYINGAQNFFFTYPIVKKYADDLKEFLFMWLISMET